MILQHLQMGTNFMNHRQRKVKFMFSLIMLLIAVAPAFAHDESMHRGPRREGTVQSVNADKLQLQTEKGPLIVVLVKETKVEMGMEGQSAKREDIQVGDFLMVSGHVLESGELAAGDIMIHRKPQKQQPEHRQDKEEQKGKSMQDMPGMH